VGGDAELAHARILGPDDVDRRRQPARPPALIEEVRDGDGAEGAPGEGLAEGGVERAGAHLVEEPEQLGRWSDQRLAAEGERVEECGGVRAGLAEAITAAECMRAALLGDERGQMGVVVDPLPAIIAARVAGDLPVPVEDPHDLFGGDEGEGAADERVRDRVVVAVETDVRGLAGRDGAEERARERVLGQRQEPWLLFGERLGHALLAPARHRPRGGDLGDPAGELRVEILDRPEGAGGEERVAQEADEALRPSLFVSPGGRPRLGSEVIVPGELEQAVTATP
jgi:hypothetical protein